MMPSMPDIQSSVRTSSKRKAKALNDNAQDVKSLEQQNSDVQEKIKKTCKRMKSCGSVFGSKHWDYRIEYYQLKDESIRIRKRLSMTLFQATAHGGDWATTAEAANLESQARAMDIERSLVEKHAPPTFTDDHTDFDQGRLHQSYVHLYMQQDKKSGVSGRRDASEQSNFRQALIDNYNSRLDNFSDGLWCPITKRVWPGNAMTAAHIFPYQAGEASMDTIFGRCSEESELFSPRNGLLLPTDAEKLFDKGVLLLVPDIEANPTADAVRDWHRKEPRNFKIRILDKRDKALSLKITLLPDKTWGDMDGEILEFRSDFRPRARYLYFHYVYSALRWNLAGPKEQYVLDELGHQIWATNGPYMKRGMLRAFVREIGHSMDSIMEGASEEGDSCAEIDDLALAVAIQKVTTEQERRAAPDSEDEDEDEDDEENENT